MFLDDPDTPVDQATQTNKGHGRTETGTANVSCDVAWVQERRQWPGLMAVGKITASRQQEKGASVETRYCQVCQKFPPDRFNSIVREHWGIENRLHWAMDVAFNEDQSRNRRGNGPENMALLRNLARLEPSK